MRSGGVAAQPDAHKPRRGLLLTGHSPVSLTAGTLTIALAMVGIALVLRTDLRFSALPNILPLIAGVMVIDILSRFAPQTRKVTFIQALLSGILCLVIICYCAVVAAYASQRFVLPLQDGLFAQIDLALGFDWLAVVRWVDQRPFLHLVLSGAYDSLSFQVALPVIVLALSNQVPALRVYILAFALTLIITITISALLPAAGPIAGIDLKSFDIMRFTGATPLDHLARLRHEGPLILTDAPGGIATFPSFHAAVAVLVPLTLRRFRILFVPLLLLDAAMLGGTITEGAHYFCDTIAGAGLAVTAHLLAARLIVREDAWSARRASTDVTRGRTPVDIAGGREVTGAARA